MKRAKNLTAIFSLYAQKPQISLLKPYIFTKKIQTLPQFTPNRIEPISQNPLSSFPSPQNSIDCTTVCETLTSYSNDHNKALEFFIWVETDCGFKHTTETFNSMIDTLGKVFDFDKCWELIYSMKLNPISMPNYVTFRIMYKRYVSAHYVNEAIAMFDKLDEFGLKDETSFCHLIDALCEHKHVIEAEDFWTHYRSRVTFSDEKGTQTKVHNMMLRGYAKMGWWSKCREFWLQMDHKGVCKDLRSYTVYMDAEIKAGRPWKAMHLYHEMGWRKIKLDVVAYNTAILATGLKDGVDFSVRLFKEMIEFGIVPDVATYNTLINLFCEYGRMEEAYGMVYDMRKRGCEPNVITYHAFFKTLVKPQEIMKLFERMLERGLRPKIDTYVMLMRKFAKWGFLRPIMFIWDKMKELGVSPNAMAYIVLIDALLDKGLLDMAKKYDDQMIAKGLSAKPRVVLGTKTVSETVAGSPIPRVLLGRKNVRGMTDEVEL